MDKAAIFADGGEMGALMRAHDWTASPLGSPEGWPSALHSALSTCLNAQAVGAIYCGPEFRLLYNDAYRPFLGAKHPWALGRTMSEIWPTMWQALTASARQVHETGRGVIAEDQRLMMERDGSLAETFWFYSFAPILDGAGRVEGMALTALDTTGRVLAERGLAAERHALQVSEARYRTLFENIDAAFCVVEVIFDEDDRPIDHRFVEINPAFERQSGLKDALGRRAREILPDHEQHWFDIYGEIVKTGKPARFENGSDALGRWFDVHALRVGSPEQPRVAILFTDITERRRAEAGLRELNETLATRVAEQVAERNLLATLVETTDVMVMAADLDYRILAINKANADEFERIYGARPAVGDDLLDLLADQPEHRAQVQAGWARALAGEESTFVEDYGDPDHIRPHYEIRFRTLRDQAGEPVGAYQFVSDVTGRLREQAQLAEAQEALRQSQKVEAIGQLMGGVAHDFNNLLTVIRGSIDLLRRPALSEERRGRYLDAISDTTDRATRLTSQLLAFARRQTLKAETFDAAASIATLRDMIGTLSGSRVVVDVETGSGPRLIRADRSQFDTAIVNIAVNARDAMSGEGTLTIGVREADGIPATRLHPAVPGPFIAVSIADTGSGIEPDLVDRIFEPFYTTKGVGHGTGLGLSQVYGFAKQSSGEVMVQSRPGLGSTFTIYLPKAPDEAVPPVQAEEYIKPLRQGARILIVEDNGEVGSFATQALTELGYEPHLAIDAATALVALGDDGNGFDLIFSDVVMPGMSGIELGREIHRRLPGLPIVLTSGYSSVLAEQDAHEFELLHKPYSLGELARILARVSAGADGT